MQVIKESPSRKKTEKKNPKQQTNQPTKTIKKKKRLPKKRDLYLFLAFDKTKECACTDTCWRETLLLSIFCRIIFIWSFHDEKTALDTLNYVACEKTSTEIFVATQSPSSQGRQFSWHLCQGQHRRGLGTVVVPACWGTACATSCPLEQARRGGLEKGWVFLQQLCYDLQSQCAMAFG